MFLEFTSFIPIIIKDTGEEGYAIYVRDGGQYENDIWTCVLCNGGIVRHYRTDQILIYKNTTFDIKELK